MNVGGVQSHWLLLHHLVDLVLRAQNHTQNVHLEKALELCRICFGDLVNLASNTCRVADPPRSVEVRQEGVRLTYAA
jgi:hypothetical protein